MEMRGFKWSDILSAIDSRSTTVPVSIEFRNSQAELGRGQVSAVAETNGLAVDDQRSILYSAAGDGNAYAWDLGRGCQCDRFQGHTDYLHCIALSTGRLATGSEDGTVRLWDPRTSQCLRVFDPTVDAVVKSTSKRRKSQISSRWVGCVALDEQDTWMVCGGGGRYLALYHLASGAVTATMPTAGVVQSALFHQDKIVSAGNEPFLYHWGTSGQLEFRAKSSVPSIFGLALNDKVLVASGYAPLVDVFKDFHYRAFALDPS